jgi:hypothetical protein
VDELTVTGVLYGGSEDGEVSLNDVLVQKSFAVNVSQQTIEEKPKCTDTVVSYTSTAAKLGDKINLFCVSADSPASIWCQLSDFEAELLELMEKLGAFYGSLDENECAVEEPVIGAAVCAQFTEDDSWYRAEILETSPSIMVRFVDYGNSEELPRSRVKRLTEDFAVLPKQAISFALSGVSSQSLQDWSDEKKFTMDELCSEKCYVGEILETTDTAILVSLQDQESHAMLLDELCQANLVIKKSEVDSAPDSNGLVHSEVPAEEQPVDDTTNSEEQPVDDTTTSEEQPDDDTKTSAEQAVDDTPTSEVQPVDDTSEVQAVDDTPTSEEQPKDDTPTSEEQPVDDTPTLEVQSEDDTPTFEEQPVDDTTTSEEQPKDDTPTSAEQPKDDTPTSEVQSVDDTPTSAEQPVDDTQTSEEQPVDDDTSTSEEQPIDDTTTSEEQVVDDTATSEEQAVYDTSTSNEQAIDDTSTLEAQPVHDTPVLEEQAIDVTSDLVEALPDERPSVVAQTGDVVPNTNTRINEAENVTRTASPGDSEELNDATAICHAIERVLAEIDSREDDRSATPETSDTELAAALGIDNVQAEEGTKLCNEEAVATTPSEEAPSDEVKTM